MGQMSRRALLAASAAAGAAIGAGAWERPGFAASADGPIVKPLPPELFRVFGSNAEMRWEAMRGQGYFTPIDRFFVRNHTRTPIIDERTWRLRLWGSGLRGSPSLGNAVEFTYRDLLGMRSRTVTAFMECAGNARGFFTSQQGQPVSGTPWRLGAIGVARWQGVPLADVLARAGLKPSAVDIMPRGLDPEFVDDGENLGHVRRPLPVRKALQDVLLAYRMNGETLPPDHGFPVRLVVPNWVGIASIKWVGDIEVSDRPIVSPWNTRFYRLFGPDYPPEGGPPLSNQVVKSAFEVAWEAELAARARHVLRGRSWSGRGRIRRVEVSTDGGRTWGRALPRGPSLSRAWLPWAFRWEPRRPGSYVLMARAVDVTGATQPDRTPHNTLGYLFDAVVRHPVTVG